MMLQKLKNYLWHWPKAVFFSAWYGFPGRKLTVVGVTGTKGKTTTAHMIYHILSSCEPRRHFFNALGSESSLPSSSPLSPHQGKVLQGSSSRVSKMSSSVHQFGRVGLISTIGAFFGEEEIDTGLHVTSPDPRELQKLLRMAIDRGITHMVLEVTSSGLDQFRVWGIKFKAAVITNIYPDHLDYHGTMEKYVAAKAKIIRQSEVTVLPQKFLDRYARSFDSLANARSLRMTNSSGDSFLSENRAAAVSVAEVLGIKRAEAINALKDFRGVKGRLEVVYRNKFTVVIDFAHTPESLAAALTELGKLVKKNGRLIAVFGCAGERDHGRRRMGEVAAKMADLFVITAEDPRSESVEDISEEIAGYARSAGAIELTTLTGSGRSSGVPSPATPHSFVRIPDRQEAINWAIHYAKEGDVVVLFGKGHEKSMAFGKKEIPWSEYEAVDKALNYVRDIRIRRQ